MFDAELTRALKLARNKRYGEAITLLEGDIFLYQNSFSFYYILALSCLYSGEAGPAYTYLRRAHALNDEDPNVLLGIAALQVKRCESARAVSLYLKVLGKNRHCRQAKRGLRILRKYGGSEDLFAWVQRPAALRSLYPAFPRLPVKKRVIVVPLVVVGLALAIGAAVTGRLPLPDVGPKEAREGFTNTVLDAADKKELVELGGAYTLILTEKQVIDLFEAARREFNRYDDNRARVPLNKILLSNAGAGVKAKARVLTRYLDEAPVTFDTLKNNLPYDEVARKPAIYAGCAVNWSGMATNITLAADTTAFDFLVGYEKKTQLLGTVRVMCPFAAAVSSEKPLAVLGRVVAAADGGGFTLAAISLHIAP
jgi:hypothetical protein